MGRYEELLECRKAVNAVLKEHGVSLYSDFTEGLSWLCWEKNGTELTDEDLDGIEKSKRLPTEPLNLSGKNGESDGRAYGVEPTEVSE